jgi:aldehyde:ferredoxin oxidoreductase
MDTVSCGMTIAFAMECFERGIITKEDTGGIDLRFGNAGAMLEVVEKIAAREGFGDTLAEGAKRAAEIIGGDAPQYALQVKGQEFAMAEPRSKFGLGLAFAVSPTGADHIQHEHDGAFDPALTGYSHDADNPMGMLSEIFPLGILQPVPSLSIGPDKVRLFTYFQSFWSLFECIDTCVFTWAPVRTWKVHQMVEMVRAVTGWDTSLWELMKVGERATTMTRCFNLKAGLTAEDDSLPDRVFDPLPEGPLEGSRLKRDEMDDAVHLYYGMMGWDEETGIPTRARLYELDIPWAMD